MIKFDRVSKTYKQTIHALDDVSLEIIKGEFVFLVGASGSGKSTFIKLLLKDVAPDTGEIVVAGKNLNGMRAWRVPAFRRELGCVFQDFKLLESKTVFENVALPRKRVTGSLLPAQIRVDVPDALEGRRPCPQALGPCHTNCPVVRQQRVSIARAIVKPAADHAVRRADGKPGPRDLCGDHEAVGPDQPCRNHDPDGDPRLTTSSTRCASGSSNCRTVTWCVTRSAVPTGMPGRSA